MQFTVWRHSGKSRIIIDFITTIIIASMIHRFLKKVVEADEDIYSRVGQVSLLELKYNEATIGDMKTAAYNTLKNY
jgi:hypothetical protein